MSYKDNYGITQITASKRDNLSISYDDMGEGCGKEPVLLYTPNMDDSANHEHIMLTRNEAKILHRWLSEYLADVKE